MPTDRHAPPSGPAAPGTVRFPCSERLPAKTEGTPAVGTRQLAASGSRRTVHEGSWKAHEGSWKAHEGSWKAHEGSWKAHEGAPTVHAVSWTVDESSWAVHEGAVTAHAGRPTVHAGSWMDGSPAIVDEPLTVVESALVRCNEGLGDQSQMPVEVVPRSAERSRYTLDLCRSAEWYVGDAALIEHAAGD